MTEPDHVSQPAALPPEGTGAGPQLSFIERHGISYLLFGLVSLMVIFFLYEIVGGVLTFLLVGMKPTAGNVTGFRIATAVGQIAFILVPTLILARFATRNYKDFLRLRMPAFKAIIFPVIGIFSLQQLLQVYLMFQDRIPTPERLRPLIEQFRELIEQAYMMLVGSHSPGELFVVIVVVALIPAVVEELMFRGLVQQSFERSLTPSRGVVVTGVVFAAYHLNPFAFIPLCALGIYLGFLAMRAGSIWVSATAHFVNNAAASVAVYLHFDDNAIVNGNPETMPPQVLLPTVFVFAVIFVASTYMFIHVTRHRQAAGAEDGAPA